MYLIQIITVAVDPDEGEVVLGQVVEVQGRLHLPFIDQISIWLVVIYRKFGSAALGTSRFFIIIIFFNCNSLSAVLPNKTLWIGVELQRNVVGGTFIIIFMIFCF